MRTPRITQTEFTDFFEAVSAAYGAECFYCTGNCTNTEPDDYSSWKFCLANQFRSTYLLIPAKLAFFFINVALSNFSPLPNTITTEDISYARLRYLHCKYGIYQLKHIQPYA
jgi:hypothetical protein